MVHRLIPIVLFALADAPSAPAARRSRDRRFRSAPTRRRASIRCSATWRRCALRSIGSCPCRARWIACATSSRRRCTGRWRRWPTSRPGPHAATDARQCPAATGAPYARALASGGRYLALGQQLQATYREIRRADDLGDTLGLTPDYRLRAKKAKDMHQQLLSDYREMRVAFYDQLGAELRHAGCKLTAKGIAASLPPGRTRRRP